MTVLRKPVQFPICMIFITIKLNHAVLLPFRQTSENEGGPLWPKIEDRWIKTCKFCRYEKQKVQEK